MPMNNRAFLTALLLSAVLLVTQISRLSLSARAQLGEVGVDEGDWAKYGNVTVSWSSNDPQAEPDPSLVAANQTVWFRHNVTKVVGAVITFQNETYLQTNELVTDEVWIDIEDGFGDGILMFISANLQAPQLIYASSSPLIYINRTLTRTYLGVERQVNQLNLTYRDSETDPTSLIQISFIYYWDRKTGVLAERQASFSNQTGEYLTSWSRSDTIVATNIVGWVADTEPPQAKAGDNKTVSQGETVYFDASSSTDNVGIVSYRWSFGDSTTITQPDPNATHIYTEPGTYTVTLTVEDHAGLSSTDQITVNVKAVTSNTSFPTWVLVVPAIVLFGVLILYLKKRKSRYITMKHRARTEK